MQSQNIKVVYSLRVHLELQKLGFKYETEMRNPNNPKLNCWVYNADAAFNEAFDALMDAQRGTAAWKR